MYHIKSEILLAHKGKDSRNSTGSSPFLQVSILPPDYACFNSPVLSDRCFLVSCLKLRFLPIGELESEEILEIKCEPENHVYNGYMFCCEKGKRKKYKY